MINVTNDTEAERQTFQCLAYAWDITAALQLVEGRLVDAVINVNDASGWLRMIGIDKAYAATVDLTKPLLIVPVSDDNDPGEPPVGHFIIDGWHRLHRAVTEGVETLPAFLLTPAEERQVRIHGGINAPRPVR